MGNRIGDIEELKGLIGKNDNFQRPNLFRVTLPPIKGYNAKDLNLLCKAVLMPGRQLGTIEKQVGMYKYDIVNQMSIRSNHDLPCDIFAPHKELLYGLAKSHVQ